MTLKVATDEDLGIRARDVEAKRGGQRTDELVAWFEPLEFFAEKSPERVARRDDGSIAV
jgi:hypothetical protein